MSRSRQHIASSTLPYRQRVEVFGLQLEFRPPPNETITAEIEKDRAALDKRADAEEARWNNKLERLEADLSLPEKLRLASSVQPG